MSHLRRLGSAPKHQLVDPALAARLLGVDSRALFESLATLSVRTFADAAEARVGHLRTATGSQEVDLVVERDDKRVVGIEVKLARTIDDNDVRHLNWLDRRLGDQLLDKVILTTGPSAYRRSDGVAVVPLALLGP